MQINLKFYVSLDTKKKPGWNLILWFRVESPLNVLLTRARAQCQPIDLVIQQSFEDKESGLWINSNLRETLFWLWNSILICYLSFLGPDSHIRSKQILFNPSIPLINFSISLIPWWEKFLYEWIGKVQTYFHEIKSSCDKTPP